MAIVWQGFGFLSARAPEGCRQTGAFCDWVAKHTGNRVSISRSGVSRRGPITAWVHSPGPTNRHFSQDELAISASTVLWLRLTLHVPNPAPGGRDALVLMPDDTSHDRKEQL